MVVVEKGQQWEVLRELKSRAAELVPEELMEKLGGRKAKEEAVEDEEEQEHSEQ